MCKQFIFWATEYLNYYSLIFWGIKLFLKKYGVKTGRKEWVENAIIIVVSAPVVWFCVFNYKFVNYSNAITYTLCFYIYLFIKIYTKRKEVRLFTLIAIYIHGMRLIDLLIVTIIFEINRMSRFANWDLINIGIERSVFMVFLSIISYLVYEIFTKGPLMEYLYENTIYRCVIYVYSFMGIVCFFQVYRFDYSERLIQFWTFYLVCLFIVCGIFMFYFLFIKEEEKKKLLYMRNDMLEVSYQSLRKAYDENRMMYHDFKNHLLVINQLLQEKRTKEVLEYINTCIHWTLTINQRVETGCKIIDIIVNCKIADAIDKDIDFKYEIDYIGEICIKDNDMCALLANLLDNAIEACEKIEKEERRIYLRIKKKNEMLLIWIENSKEDRKLAKRDFFRTCKENKELHGLGMKSIDNVIKKYDGHKEYEILKDKFLIYISIPIN